MVDYGIIFCSHTGNFVVERVQNRFEERVSHNCQAHGKPKWLFQNKRKQVGVDRKVLKVKTI